MLVCQDHRIIVDKLGLYFCPSVLAGVGSSIQKVETLAGMVKKKMTGLFQVPSYHSLVQMITFCENSSVKRRMQVNKTGERIVREYWEPKSEDLVSGEHIVHQCQKTHILKPMGKPGWLQMSKNYNPYSTAPATVF